MLQRKKITAPPNAWRNIPLIYYFSTPNIKIFPTVGELPNDKIDQFFVE